MVAKSNSKSAIVLVLLVWNSLAIVTCIAWWAYADWVGGVNVTLRVADLDRAGVINNDKVAQSFPTLVQTNMRYDLGMWITEKLRRTSSLATITGTLAGVINIIMLVLLYFQKRMPGQTNGPPVQRHGLGDGGGIDDTGALFGKGQKKG